MQKLTIYAIHLYEKLLDRAIARRSSPIQSGSIGTDTGERNIGGLWNINTKNADEVGCRLP